MSTIEDVSARNAMRNTLAQLGITVIPDPIPEPEGDVIVVDKYTVCWRKGRNIWIDIACGERRPWSDLDGPVKIYRLEGETKWAASRREPSEAATVACPHWSPGRITMRTGCTACAADAEPSNTDEREALAQRCGEREHGRGNLT